MLKIITISISLTLVGCSAVEKIQNNSNSIRTLALDSKENFEKINEAATAEPPRVEEIKERSNQGISEQTEIIAKAEGIIEVTPRVEDVIPWWANFLQILVIGITTLAVIVFLWYSGVGVVIRRLIGFIPEAKRQEAKMLDEAIQGTTSLREAVAFIRAKDPELDTAFKKRKKNAKL